jgi:hypothetical protein
MPQELEWFKANRKEQFEFAINDILGSIWKFQQEGDLNFSKIIVDAPVKSGKRIIVEILAKQIQKYTLNHAGLMLKRIMFVTSLHRKDIRPQLEELKDYGVSTFSLRNKVSVEQAINFIRSHKEGELLIAFDESDYGTDIKQLFAGVFAIINEMKHPTVLFSATNQEAILAYMENAKVLRFKPNRRYKGAKELIEAGRVVQSEPFYDPVNCRLTTQAEKYVSEFAASDNAISVVRFNNPKELKAFTSDVILRGQLKAQHKIKVQQVTMDNEFVWGENGSWEELVEDYQALGVKTLLAVHKTCTRSTEIGFHQHLNFWHDNPAKGANYNTILQAALRVAHYSPLDKDEDYIYPFTLICDVASLNFAAEMIGLNEYESETGRKLSSRHTRSKEYNNDIGADVFFTLADAVKHSQHISPGYKNKDNYKEKDDQGHLLALFRKEKGHQPLYVYGSTLEDMKDEVERWVDKGSGVNSETKIRIYPAWNTTLDQQVWIRFYWKDDESSKTIVPSKTNNRSTYNSGKRKS